MTRAKVAVIFTGGTISMLADAERGGAVPALDAQAILQRAPALAEIAEIVALNVPDKPTPAVHLTFTQLFDILNQAEALCQRPDIQGVIITQGTDTIEETSFFWDLLSTTHKPVVITGAMRNASQQDYDGPQNLLDAVRVAIAPHMQRRGVSVVMAGNIHCAEDATKASTTALDAFHSPHWGPLGRVDAEHVLLHKAARVRREPLRAAHAALPIPIIAASVGIDGALLEAVLEQRPAGLVIEAPGAGNTSPSLLEAGARAVRANIPVVIATRCRAGSAAPAYAFVGGSVHWQERGALLAGRWSAVKARIALALALGAGLRGKQLRDFFATSACTQEAYV